MLKIYLIILMTIYLPSGEEKYRMTIQETPTFGDCVELGDEIKQRIAPVIAQIIEKGEVKVTVDASCKAMELEVNGVTL